MTVYIQDLTQASQQLLADAENLLVLPCTSKYILTFQMMFLYSWVRKQTIIPCWTKYTAYELSVLSTIVVSDNLHAMCETGSEILTVNISKHRSTWFLCSLHNLYITLLSTYLIYVTKIKHRFKSTVSKSYYFISFK